MWANESVGGGSVGVVACKGHFMDRDDDNLDTVFSQTNKTKNILIRLMS